MRCPHCTADNPDGHRFCGQCGGTLARRCPACDGEVEAHARFCGQCGAALDAGSPPSVAHAPVAPVGEVSDAERRHVSVLFVDLVGFTTLSEQRDPEDVRELLSAYFEQARTVVSRYGGAIEKFIGDAVMAVWGTPVAREDDAERAVRAGLELVDAVAALGEGSGTESLQARAGVVTGQAAVRLEAVGEGMVAGDVVNTAARVQATAVPGTVLVDDATREASSRAVSYAAAGEHQLKGRVEPVRLFTAVQVVAGGGGAQRFDGLEPPFIGRERELRLVKELFHDAVEHARARLVVVSGAAGVGKSRLGWEFFKYVDGLVQMSYWHVGRCLSYGEGVAYWALAEMMRMRLRIAEGDPETTAVAKLDAGLAEAVDDPDERAWLRPRLAVLLGLADAVGADAGEVERDSLFAGWRVFLERLARRDPVVLLFEDMQYADAGLLDFLDHLLEWSADLPIFVVVLTRPELHDARPAWNGHRSITPLYLDPLLDEPLERMLDAMVAGLPESTRRSLAARAEGIPLFAIETVRMLIDRDLVQPRDGRYVLAADVGDLDDLEVPPTLQALVAARLDNLPEDERRLVKDASVLGHAFTPVALRALVDAVGGAGADVDELLASLSRREVVTVRGDARSPEAGQYRFVQKVMRTVAYDTLSRRDRKARHLAAATHLEAHADAEDIAGVIATHYLSAAEAVPDAEDAATLRATAVRHLERAGDRARGLASPEEAHRYYERALELAEEATDRNRLAEQAGMAAWRAGRYEKGLASLEQALELAEGRDADGDVARIAARVGDLRCELGRFHQALDLMTSVHDRVASDRQDANVAELANSIATALFQQGDPEAALPWLEQALVTAEAAGAWKVLGRALNVKGLLLHGRRRPVEGVGLMRAALDLADQHGLHDRAAIQSGNLALLAMHRDLDEAVRLATRAQEHARLSGDHTNMTFTLVAASLVRIHAGDWDAIDVPELRKQVQLAPTATRSSLGLVLASLATWTATPELRGDSDVGIVPDADDLQVRAAVALTLALDAEARGDVLATLGNASDAVALGLELGIDTDEFLIAFPTAVTAALDAGELAEARRLVDLGLARPPGLVPPMTRAQLQWLEGRLHADAGGAEEASGLFTAAIAGFRELRARFWLARALLDQAEWHHRTGRASASAPAAEAATVFEELGARPFLDRARLLVAPVAPPVTAAAQAAVGVTATD